MRAEQRLAVEMKEPFEELHTLELNVLAHIKFICDMVQILFNFRLARESLVPGPLVI